MFLIAVSERHENLKTGCFYRYVFLIQKKQSYIFIL